MNVLSGFTTGFSFFYNSWGAYSVTIYDAADGVGNVLATIDLVENWTENSYTGDPTGENFCNWDPIGVGFSGTALSVAFPVQARAGASFDNVTLGAVRPVGVPEPTILALLGIGLTGMGFARRRMNRAGCIA